MDPSSITSAWVKALDEDLRHVRAVSAKFQQELVQERTKDTPEEFQNNIRRFVPFQRDPNVPVGQLNYLLPIRNPIKSFSNARTMWSAVMWWWVILRFCMSLGWSSSQVQDEAYQAALLDADQFVINKIHYWRGNPAKRSKMFFLVEFDDGDKRCSCLTSKHFESMNVVLGS